MKLESAVMKIRKMRIATSIIVAMVLIMMGVISTNDGVSESTRNAMLWLAMIFMILSFLIPVSYTAYLAKKGAEVPPEDDGKE